MGVLLLVGLLLPAGLEPGLPFPWGAPPPGLLAPSPLDLVPFGSYPVTKLRAGTWAWHLRVATLLDRSVQYSADTKVLVLKERLQVLEVGQSKVVQLVVLLIPVGLLLV